MTTKSKKPPAKKPAPKKPAKPASAKAAGKQPGTQLAKPHQAALTEQQIKLQLDGIGKGLYQEYRELHSLTAKEVKSSVMFYHRVGQRLTRVMERYDRRGLSTLGKLLRIDADTMRMSRRLAEAYNHRELEKLLARRGPDGQQLTWAHLRQLLAVNDQAQRVKLEDAVIEQGLSYRDTAVRVQVMLGKRPANKASAPLRLPNTIDGRIKTIKKMAGVFAERMAGVLGDGFSKLCSQTPKSEVAAATMDELAELAAELDSIAKLATEEAKRLRGLSESLAGSAAQNAAPPVAAANGHAAAGRPARKVPSLR